MSSSGVAVCTVRNRSGIGLNFGELPEAILEEPIWIYVALSGITIPMPVLECDSIESVKLRIQSCQGFVVRKQKLVCGGRELARNASMVRDYGVADGNVLHLIHRLSDLKVINVRTVCGKEFTFNVERGRDVGYVKQKIAKKEKGYVDLDEQEVLCDGERVEDQQIIDELCKNDDAVIHLLVRKSAKIRIKSVDKNIELSIVAPKSDKQNVEADGSNKIQYDVDAENHMPIRQEFITKKLPVRDFFLEPVIVNPKIELSQTIWDLINSTCDGLGIGKFPVISTEGTGGAYFMLDALGERYISVFKPTDEEPMAVHNPRGLPLSVDGVGLKGTRVGEGAFREVAAYILDHPKNGRRSIFGDGNGFAGVPPTALVKCLHEGFNHPKGLAVKIGSLQMFMENNGSCEDMGPGAFPVDEVHKISVLDMRLANTDRHAGNILLSKDEDGQTVLIPIDHGYCLPGSFEDCTFDWLYWPQACKPYSPEIIDYIRSLDAEKDIALLKFYGWDLPVECARTLRISTMLLKKGTEKGLTPFTIGSIMCRPTLKKESTIEEIIREAEDSLLPCTGEDSFLEAVAQVMDCRLDGIAASLTT